MIGTGSFGVVHEAFDSRRNRVVALKMLTQADAASVARFKREFRSLAELRHPNLASLYELFVLGDGWALSMELVTGSDLLEHLSFAELQSTFLDAAAVEKFDPDARISLHRRSGKGEKLSATYVQQVGETFRQLAEGIAFLHANDVVHRDIKPSNVMITHEGRVVLLDFGLAIDARSDATLDEDLIVGTPGYMSPEQIAMGKPAPSSDWYSFGVMLYQALTGRGLFTGANTAEILDQQMRATPIPAHLIVPGLPEELCTLADRCLDRDPTQRPTEGEILEVFGSSLIRARGNVREHERLLELIGRGREVRTLVRQVTTLVAEGSGMVLLHGSPGVGKSVLADRALDEIRAKTGALIVGGRCHGWESLPFNAIDAIVDSVGRAARLEPSEAIEDVLRRSVAMTALFPTLAFRAGGSSDEETVIMPQTPEQVTARASSELIALLAAVSRDRPVVLFLDDAQWGDYQSADVFVRVLRGHSPVPIVLILCYSTEDWRTSLLLQAMLNAPVRQQELHLEPLSAVLADKLVKRDFPRASRTQRQVAVEQSEGNPSLVELILRHGATDPSKPPSLADAIGARLAGLSTSAQRVFAHLVSGGGPLTEDEIESHLELFESDEPLRALTRARLIRLRRTGDLLELDLYHPSFFDVAGRR